MSIVDYLGDYLTQEPEAWREYARCRSVDPEIFFSDDPKTMAMAFNCCSHCISQPECRSWSLTLPTNTVGIFAGLTTEDRWKLRRSRKS